jgi:short-subunit dehydrogenase
VRELENALAPFGAAIVTGGSSGIGRAFIELYGKARPGGVVCNLSRRKPEVNERGVELLHVPCDLARPEERQAALKQVQTLLEALTGRPKVLLLNNAGIGAYGFFPAPGVARQRALVELNVTAPLEVVAAFLPALQRQGGAIVNVASTAAFQATAYLSAYGASKAFLLNWSLALRQELRPAGIDVQALCPGPVRTEFFKAAGLAEAPDTPGLMAEPDEVVWAMARGLRRRRAIVVVGWRNRVLTAAGSLLPRAWAAALTARVLARHRLRLADVEPARLES